MFGRTIKYIVDKIYDGNLFAFKADPIVGTVLSTGTIWGIDYHLALTKIVGTVFLAIMSVSIGVLWPLVLRYTLHRYKHKSKFIADLLTHDKHEPDDRQDNG